MGVAYKKVANAPYQKLANAIILQAANDYRHNKKYRSSIARFFRSDWFKVLTNINGEYLLQKSKAEVNQNNNQIKEEI